MRTLVLLASLLIGCGANYDRIPGQDLATQLVWVDTYGQTGSPPPIEWVTQPGLNCAPDGNGKNMGFYRGRWLYDPEMSGQCVAGVFWTGWFITQVAIPDGFKIHETAFAHELLHAAMDNANQYDPEHLDPAWGISEGRGYNLLDLAQDKLKENGL